MDDSLLISKLKVYGFSDAIRGARNSFKSWENSDADDDKEIIGPQDFKFLETLANSSGSERKFLRMINVVMDIEAPLYWWKQFDTYKVGTVAQSTSTMHSIFEERLTLQNFSLSPGFEYFRTTPGPKEEEDMAVLTSFMSYLDVINQLIDRANEVSPWSEERKEIFRVVNQMLPQSYRQLRTVQLNYEVLRHMYTDRYRHKLVEWRSFCRWMITTLPYGDTLILPKELSKTDGWDI